MRLDDIQGKVNPYIQLIIEPVSRVEDAEEASNKFLLVRSYLSDCYYDAEKRLGLLKGLEKATYAEAFSNVGVDETGKKLAVNAREYEADRDSKYQEVLAEKAEAEAILSWIDLNIKIFVDATVAFRQKAERLGRNF